MKNVEKIDIAAVSKELKNFVRKYDTTQFLGELSSMMHWINPDNPPSFLQGLSSPQKQFFYLAALNVTAPPPDDDELSGQFSDEEWAEMITLLQKIELGYDQLFDPTPGEEINEDWQEKRRIAMPAFLTYYNQGLLNYDEQIIERVDTYFSRYTDQIEKRFGLSVKNFIAIYNWIDALANNFFMTKLNRKEGDRSWTDFADEIKAKNLMPWEWNDYLPERQRNLFEFMSDKGQMHRFTIQDIAESFGLEKARAFLSIFTGQRKESDFLFYTEKNPLYHTPVFQIDADTYQAFELKHLILAVYNVLTSFCLKHEKIKDSFIKHRGNMLEAKIEQLFRNFAGKDAIIHKAYYTDAGPEQDLLCLAGGAAFIIESKADKLDEPRRDPDKAYPVLMRNFRTTIQKGYDQSYRVKEKFLSKQVLSIYRDEKKQQKIVDIKTKNYYSSFSIVVTLERFAHLQMDLTGALEIYENDEYPWSICVDDLEMILLVMKKEGKKVSDLVRYLQLRERIQGRVVAHDETAIFGHFLRRGISKEAEYGDEPIFIPLDSSNIFDNYYEYNEMGLPNEKNLEVKKSGQYLPVGSVKFIHPTQSPNR